MTTTDTDTILEFLADLRPYTLRVIRKELRDREDYHPELIDEITQILIDLDGDEE